MLAIKINKPLIKFIRALSTTDKDKSILKKLFGQEKNEPNFINPDSKVGYSEEIDKKVQMFRVTPEAKWEKIHEKTTQFTVYMISKEEIMKYSNFLLCCRLCVGMSVVINAFIYLGKGLTIFNPYFGMGISLLSLVGIGLGYSTLSIERKALIPKITYDTGKRMFNFASIEKNHFLKDNWVHPKDIGVCMKPTITQTWIYYNKITGQKYHTVGTGQWVNEELFLYSLLRNNNYLQTKDATKKLEGRNDVAKLQGKSESVMRPVNKKLLR